MNSLGESGHTLDRSRLYLIVGILRHAVHEKCLNLPLSPGDGPI